MAPSSLLVIMLYPDPVRAETGSRVQRHRYTETRPVVFILDGKGVDLLPIPYDEMKVLTVLLGRFKSVLDRITVYTLSLNTLT